MSGVPAGIASRSVLPANVARRFPDERLDPDRREDRDRLIGRLLEAGDSAELAWLAAALGPAAADELAAWFDLHAARRLSRRKPQYGKRCVLAFPPTPDNAASCPPPRLHPRSPGLCK